MKKYKTLNKRLVPENEVDIVAKKINELTKEYGGEVTPNILLQEAEQPNSVLHKYFEWDQSKAAKEYRLWQARKLLGAIAEVVVIKGKENPIRSFWSVSNKECKPVYVTLKKAMSNKDYTCQLFEDTQNSLQHFMVVLETLKNHIQ